ncbi:MAG: DNA-protecting protein DprA [Saprospiraceae bacterium]|nr:DNA-protecting protein DprA [Saprospiraceae bacterium]
MSSLYYEIALSKVFHVGPINARLLISYCGNAEAVFKEKKSKLLKIPGIGKATIDQINLESVLEATEKEIEFVDKNQLKTFFFLNEDYPSRLKNYADTPIILYYKGTVDLNFPRMIAIVGTRNISEYGKQVTCKLIKEINSAQVVVVSGLAYGVDTEAHRQCLLENIPTIGVLGHGLDKTYPSGNRKLAEKMTSNGGLLTQFGIRTVPDRENFPLRNKVIAALSDVTLVVESRIKGGSIITAEFANDYNKDVFAVPGRVNDELSEGCNHLIKNNKANIFSSTDDLLEFMQWKQNKKELFASKKSELVFDLEPDENAVVSVLHNNNKIHIDYLHKCLTFTPGLLASLLLNLEFKGVVKELPGKFYILNS